MDAGAGAPVSRCGVRLFWPPATVDRLGLAGLHGRGQLRAHAWHRHGVSVGPFGRRSRGGSGRQRAAVVEAEGERDVGGTLVRRHAPISIATALVYARILHAWLLMTLAIFAGCGGNQKAGGLTIAVIPKGTSHVFWQSIHAGAEKAARELGVTIIWRGPLREDDRDSQVS